MATRTLAYTVNVELPTDTDETTLALVHAATLMRLNDVTRMIGTDYRHKGVTARLEKVEQPR